MYGRPRRSFSSRKRYIEGVQPRSHLELPFAAERVSGTVYDPSRGALWTRAVDKSEIESAIRRHQLVFVEQRRGLQPDFSVGITQKWLDPTTGARWTIHINDPELQIHLRGGDVPPWFRDISPELQAPSGSGGNSGAPGDGFTPSPTSDPIGRKTTDGPQDGAIYPPEIDDEMGQTFRTPFSQTATTVVRVASALARSVVGLMVVYGLTHLTFDAMQERVASAAYEAGINQYGAGLIGALATTLWHGGVWITAIGAGAGSIGVALQKDAPEGLEEEVKEDTAALDRIPSYKLNRFKSILRMKLRRGRKTSRYSLSRRMRRY